MAFLCLGSSPTFAARTIARLDSSMSHPFGLGVILGEPTGFNAAYNMNENAKTDFGLTYSFREYFMMYSDLDWHFRHLFHGPEALQFLSPYLGGGLGFRISTKERKHTPAEDQSNGFIRIPLGLQWDYPRQPRIAVFAEIVPGMSFVPSAFFLLQGGLGIRYYF